MSSLAPPPVDPMMWGSSNPLRSRNPFLTSVTGADHSRNPFYDDIFSTFDDASDSLMASPKSVVSVPSASSSPDSSRPSSPASVVSDVSSGTTAITTPTRGSSPPLLSSCAPPVPSSEVLESSEMLPTLSATTASSLELLLLLEPNPVKPPSYSSLPPGGLPRFNVLDNLEPETLPSYQPSVYKLAVVSRKPEWLSPYTPATSRSWKYVVAELNSTQLNIYAIPAHMESAVLSFQAQDPCTTGAGSAGAFSDLAHLNSAMTTPQDLAMHRHCRRLGVFGDRRRPALLLRSYSLHHAKLGLATDYKKRNNVLRVRMEHEQFLLGFDSVQHLIDWNAALSAGRDVAPEINDRDMPKYRTVPRRRRRHRRSASSATALTDLFNGHMSSTRPRSASDPASIFRKIKRKFSHTNLQQQGQMPPAPVAAPTTHRASPPSSPRPHASSSSASSSAAPSPSPTPRSRSSTRGASDDDDDQEDVEMADLRDLEDEEEDDLDDELLGATDASASPSASSSASRSRSRAPSASRYVAAGDKWRPDDGEPSRYRYYKQCLRCIKPLTSDETWVGRSTVRPVAQSTFTERPGPTREVDDHLGRLRSHFLQECIVCPQGLVPRV
ncbi:hypothetical protein DIURU_000307 [Diutina rugosa]|uniref:PH domain-containing protein n=1 Tax=Diutina rugosa TaxID=5481 RepID=A0A642UYJ9_DIURU|nr:uncharacterized protein DIURU_000307 [Diutina rugosa]KAA8907897.1 hypothetical protein DIURU_000307 [Diutina rugosa]